MMAESAKEHIRVTPGTKERLERRKRSDESYNDVIERLLTEDRDLLAGFGAAKDREGETMAETVARRKERSKKRIEDMDGEET